jgi:hypothetical protein
VTRILWSDCFSRASFKSLATNSFVAVEIREHSTLSRSCSLQRGNLKELSFLLCPFMRDPDCFVLAGRHEQIAD